MADDAAASTSRDDPVVVTMTDADAPAPAPATAAAIAIAIDDETPTTGTATPLVELDAEQAAASLKVSLADLTARATALYAQRSFEAAAELYARAAEMQAEMNGEMSPENGEILFMYGRALFKVGQAKSDVLGGRAAESGTSGEVPKKSKKKNKEEGKVKSKTEENGHANGHGVQAIAEEKEEEKQEKEEKEKEGEKKNGGATTEADKIAEEKVAIVAEKAAGLDKATEVKKPLFQFQGDENFDDSDEEEGADEGGEDQADEDEEEEDDDLAVAFEILDLARVLFLKHLETVEEEEKAQEQEGKGKEAASGDDSDLPTGSPTVRHIKERLADTHDLLAEISLENERYPNAITDSRASLQYKKELYPEESEIIAEAHFKLSLALEFASVTMSEEDENKEGKKGVMDQNLRDEAAAELEAAIASTRLKLQNKEVELATLHNPEDNEITRKQIAEVKDIISDMEQRLVDLKKPPLDVNEALGLASGGILGSALGESSAQAEVRLQEAKKNANDLTGLVRKKRKADGEITEASDSDAKKAKVDNEVEVEQAAE